MAQRPAFCVTNFKSESIFYNETDIEFEWVRGLAKVQKQKAIKSFHDQIKKQLNKDKILEISSNSPNELGVNLSAFNLKITNILNGEKFSVESAFQSSKVFENGGPYLDLLNKASREAKKDSRLKNSGNLLYFQFFNIKWPLTPKTLFYDWLYLNALVQNKELALELVDYDVFTDIEFNPNKSINCQARSAALFVSMYKSNLIIDALKSKESFYEIIMCQKPEGDSKANSQYHMDDL